MDPVSVENDLDFPEVAAIQHGFDDEVFFGQDVDPSLLHQLHVDRFLPALLDGLTCFLVDRHDKWSYFTNELSGLVEKEHEFLNCTLLHLIAELPFKRDGQLLVDVILFEPPLVGLVGSLLERHLHLLAQLLGDFALL